MDDAALSFERAAESRANPISQSGERARVGNKSWTRVRIARIEDLSDAVLGAGLTAMQMARGPIKGSLAFAEHDGVVYSSGYIGGRVALAGPLSESMITFGLGLHVAPGTRHWLNERSTGDFGVFLPGDEHDALYTPGTLYVTVTLSAERLESAAESGDLVLNQRSLGGTGFHRRRFAEDGIAELKRQFELIHTRGEKSHGDVAILGESLLKAVVQHFGRQPRASIGGIDPRGHARIVARARGYIVENLDRPLRIDEIANAAYASRRTVYRAFNEVLDETPHSYVRKLRLNRIRRDLASEAERACTVALVANRWGIGELGRLSGWYRELFGERPSDTLAQVRQRPAIAA
jgi:AraC-like DNA-binding protein